MLRARERLRVHPPARGESVAPDQSRLVAKPERAFVMRRTSCSAGSELLARTARPCSPDCLRDPSFRVRPVTNATGGGGAGGGRSCLRSGVRPLLLPGTGSSIRVSPGGGPVPGLIVGRSRRCHRAPNVAPNTMTAPIRMNRVSSVNTTPIVPYSRWSSMTTDEKQSDETRARPVQSAGGRAIRGAAARTVARRSPAAS